jgi:hypothetical protein
MRSIRKAKSKAPKAINVDDFKAVLRTFQENPRFINWVRAGRMLARLVEVWGLTIKSQLAGEFGIPEATLDMFLLYRQAADLRKQAAELRKEPWWADAQIAGLSPTQLQVYLALPEGARDFWYRAGANLAAITALITTLAEITAQAGPKEPRTAPGEGQANYPPQAGALAGVEEQGRPIKGAQANAPPSGEQNANQFRSMLEALSRIEDRLTRVEDRLRRVENDVRHLLNLGTPRRVLSTAD